MITKGKWLYKGLFVLALVLMFHSMGTVAEIGPKGLLGLLEWWVSSSYVALFLYANWDKIK